MTNWSLGIMAWCAVILYAEIARVNYFSYISGLMGHLMPKYIENMICHVCARTDRKWKVGQYSTWAESVISQSYHYSLTLSNFPCQCQSVKTIKTFISPMKIQYLSDIVLIEWVKDIVTFHLWLPLTHIISTERPLQQCTIPTPGLWHFLQVKTLTTTKNIVHD